MSLKKNISRYLDAGFPILYVNSFEESKVEETIKGIADRRTVAIWSLASGYGEYSTKTDEWEIPLTKDENTEIEAVLSTKLSFENDLERTILLIKDAHIVLENPQVIALFKEISNKISAGCDSCIILVSPVVKIPVELEKYITILENDYQSYDDICKVVKDFVNENGLPELNSKLLEDFAMAFKGLSEFEIQNLLALAVAEDGELTRKDLSLIFEQKNR